MPALFHIDEPDGQAGDETPPEHLAIQASPDLVEFAERMHNAFLESLQSKLTVALGAEARASCIRTEQSFMSRYLADAEPGNHNVVLSLEPLAGCIVLRFSSDLLFKVLDILLASPADAIGPRGESVTEIEFHVLRGFFQVFSEVLRETWRSIPPGALTVSPGGSEDNLVSYGDSHSLAMISTLEIDGSAGDFAVVIPAFLARVSVKFPGPGGSSLSPPVRITELLGSARVDMDAVLSSLTIRIGDLVALAPGQILLADKAVDSTFECLVNRRTQFRGELVSAGDRYGFQLGRADDEEADSPADR